MWARAPGSSIVPQPYRAPGLNQDIENLSFIIDSAPRTHLSPCIRDEQFVEMKSCGQRCTQIRGVLGERCLIDLNAPIDEAHNLAYHSARAQDQSLNIAPERDFGGGIAPKSAHGLSNGRNLPMQGVRPDFAKVFCRPFSDIRATQPNGKYWPEADGPLWSGGCG
jgi:hypothetical protein